MEHGHAHSHAAPRPRKQEQEDAQREVTQLAPNVLRMQLPISMPGLGHVNMYALLDERGAAVVDPGLPTPGNWKAVTDRLAQAGLAPKHVHTVIVTHSHPDHFGGAARLGRESGAEIVAHRSFRFGVIEATQDPEVSVEDLAAGQSQQRAAHGGPPVGRAQADERGHQHDPPGVLDPARHCLARFRVVEDLQPVAQPLERRARDEHAALERVVGLALERPRHGGHEPPLRGHRARAGVEEREAARAVRVLGHARLEAGLAEERGLLVSRDARDRDARGQLSPPRLAEHGGGGPHPRQHRPRHAEALAEHGVPVEVVDVEAEGAGGVGRLEGAVAVAVADQGIGIAPGDRKRIFEKFVRVENGLVHDVREARLGLSLVDQIIRAHHGRIEVESIPGQGSTFTLLLPLAETPAPQGAAVSQPGT